MESIEDLKARINSLETELNALKQGDSGNTARSKIAKMSAEVVDSNPYR